MHSAPAPPTNRKTLGAGRSGTVFLEEDPDGTAVAVKVFGSESVTKLAQVVLLGAPNPYLWCRDAVECALHRRRILAVLLRYWFGDRLRLAAGRETRWNAECRAYELRCDFVDGRPLQLLHPFADRSSELDELRTVMKELQRRLVDAGFDGLVWQAGRGNPVALNNFLRERRDADDGSARWTWIDLESGVPALVPLDPTALLTFYLPRSFRHGGPLFDDLDVLRLRAYLREHGPLIRERLGETAASRVAEETDHLERHQRAWKSLGRIRSGVRYELSQGYLTPEQAARYESRPVAWTLRVVRRGVRAGWKGAHRGIAKLRAWVRSIDVLAILRDVLRFLASQAFRAQVARAHVERRIASWAGRGQLRLAEVKALREQLQGEGTSAFLTDFGVHLAVKPFVKAIQWWLLPPLVLLNVIDESVFVVAVAVGGAALRTAYTLGRLLQAFVLREPRPWLALVTGILPVVGNAAYPLQIIYSGNNADSRIAQFILYDTFTFVGQRLPIWGGPDTLTEHFTNRLGDLVTAWSRRRSAARPDEPATVTARVAAFGPQRASSPSSTAAVPAGPRGTSRLETDTPPTSRGN